MPLQRVLPHTVGAPGPVVNTRIPSWINGTALLLSVVGVTTSGCMTVREDSFAPSATNLELQNAKASVHITGERESLRRNPFLVWTREVAPYRISLYIDVFDDQYSGVAFQTVTLHANAGATIPLSGRQQQGVFIPFEVDKFPSGNPGTVARCARFAFTTDAPIPYDTSRTVTLSADLMFKDLKGSTLRSSVSATLRPRRVQSTGSWWQCLRLISTGM